MTSKLNWTIIIAAAIAVLPPTILAIASLYKASETHNLVNSRMTELLEITKKAATADATLKEKAAEKVRQDSETQEKDTH